MRQKKKEAVEESSQQVVTTQQINHLTTRFFSLSPFTITKIVAGKASQFAIPASRARRESFFFEKIPDKPE
jgi:hypothetical protein